ncbi:class I adenylate-forming enzyme family protein [Streptomyces sp. HNM0574]|uniref:class I adenylate-forming enzyme family protein n=1 Tax=Streptomyces sp. HNM0574 TaxID=2714954 RepID=UPI00146A1C25|nr:class I adenylate-forming enzyme family protein [Streptomyces sp. HNM0574]NLU68792.1 acyl--CoA ligase [Streptomyces sp. HNM0574]
MTRTEPLPAGRAALAELPPGARVVVRLPNGPALAEVLLACFDLRLVAVPLPPRTGERAVAEIARRVSATALVDPDGTHRTGLPDVHTAPEDLAFLMFTSGSTGPQKGVMLSRSAVLGNAARTAELHGLAPDRPHGTCLPLYHCNALVMSLLGTHLTGAPLVLHTPFDPAGYFAALDAAGARTASIVPALLADLVEAGPAWPEGLEYLVTAAAPLTGDLARRFHRRYGPRLRQGYGLTEAVNFSFTTPLLDDAAFRDQYLEHAPPVGLPLPDTELRLESGEVWIRTPDLMHGYWQDDAATAAALTEDGWLRTGDLGELRDGLLVLRGRAGERINRGGEKHYPLEVERGWREAGLTGRFAAVAVDEPALGQDIGLIATDQPVPAVRAAYEQAPLRPAVIRFGGYLATSTGKPQRKAMGRELTALRLAPARYERLLRHAAAVAQDLLRDGAEDPGLRALAAAADGARAHEDDEVALGALDFLRDHWHAPGDRPADGELDRAKAGWLRALLTAWPLSAHTGQVAELAAGHGHEAAPVPLGTEAHFGASSLLVLPHGPAPEGPAWALGPLLTFLTGSPAGAGTDRWPRLARLREQGFTDVGCTVLRAGRHDLGGVLWAHRAPDGGPGTETGPQESGPRPSERPAYGPNQHTGATT